MGVSMSQIISKFPAMMLGFIGENDLKILEYDEDIEYVIVGSSEADSLNNKISNESPLGAAMLGKKVGDTVKVEAPAGVIEYKIISVQND